MSPASSFLDSATFLGPKTIGTHPNMPLVSPRRALRVSGHASPVVMGGQYLVSTHSKVSGISTARETAPNTSSVGCQGYVTEERTWCEQTVGVSHFYEEG